MISQELWLLEQLTIFYSYPPNLFFLYLIKANDISNQSRNVDINDFPIISIKNDDTTNYESSLPLVPFTNNISVRIINWFVTNFSKHYNTSLSNSKTKKVDKSLITPSVSSDFFVWNQFGSAKSAFHKHLFDPYCRQHKLRIPTRSINHIIANISSLEPPPPYILTSIAQLNFFKWAISNNLLHFVDQNFSQINTDIHKRTVTKTSSNKTKKTK